MLAASLLQNRNFRLVFASVAASSLGYGVSNVAFPWFASILTRDPLLIGMVAMAPQLPWLMFALPAGVLTDRLDRRRTIVSADLFRLVLTLGAVALALSTLSGPGAILLLAAIAFCLGTAEVLRENTAQTVTPSIVAKEDLEFANSTMWSAEQLIGQFVGPTLAGLLVAVSIGLAFSFEAATMALSAALMARLALVRPARTASQDFWQALREGVGWLWAHLQMRRLALILGGYNFLSALIWAVMVLYAQDILHLSSGSYGLLLSALALGGLGGSLAAPRAIRHLGASRGLLLSMAGFTLSSALLAFTNSPVLAGVGLVGDAFTGMIWNVTTVSYRQRHIPDALLGRVNSAYRFVGSGTRPLGSLAGGALVALAAPLGPMALQLPFLAAAAGGLLMLIYSALRLRLE